MQRHFQTFKILSFGLILGVLSNIPFYDWIFNKHWDWARAFPLSWIGAGMGYMGVFFHEIGHTIFMWFYGYPTIPVFDFNYGGGLAVAMTDQQIMILIIVWGALAYAIWLLRYYIWLQLALACMLILNVSLAFNDNHSIVLDFMGPGFECIVAGLLLFRALFDMAPRGAFERFLNAYFGFGILLAVFVDAYGLIKSQSYRLVYYEQKGSHGAGDFDKVADRLNFLDFQGVVYIWIILNILCFAVPFILYFYTESYKSSE